MTDDQPMRVLVNIFDAPALDAQVMIHQLDWTLVLLVERRLDHLKRSKNTIKCVIRVVSLSHSFRVKVRSIEINLFFRLGFARRDEFLQNSHWLVGILQHFVEFGNDAFTKDFSVLGFV